MPSKLFRVALPALGLFAAACPLPALSASFTFADAKCASFSVVDNGGGNLTITCNGAATNPGTPPPAGAPTGCAVTRVPADGNVPSAGGAIGAALYCASTATSYTWRKNGAAYAAGQGISDRLPGNSGAAALTTTYDVVACNGAACAAPITTTFVVASGAGGGGVPANNMCGQYSNVIFVDVPWGGQATANSGGGTFAAGGVLVARFTVPAGVAYGDGALGKIQVAEYNDPATYRQATLSQVACDFRGAPGPYGQPGAQDSPTGGSAALPLAWRFGNTATAEFTVTGSNVFYPQLVPGQMYFYNVRNFSQDLGNAVSCSGASCNAVISINTP
jgi:hypothetical protein